MQDRNTSFQNSSCTLCVPMFACNCYENSQAEDPAVKQEGVIAEEEAASSSDEYDNGFAENNDAVDNDDEPSKDESRDETIEERDDSRGGGFRDESKKED